MEPYFHIDGKESFVLFSFTHWMTLVVLLSTIVLIYLFRNFLRNARINRLLRIIIALILFVSEISLHTWLWHFGQWDIRYSLPLHLSSISLLLSSVLLFTKSYRLFEFTYFAGVGSALQAMLTPDISSYTFPHFRYVHFFISHGGIVIANLFFVIVERYRPTFQSLWRAFIYLNFYAFFILILNLVLKGNYMYISKKPFNPSLIDYLGPWPWYIIPLEVITLLTFFILYLPFWLHRRFK